MIPILPAHAWREFRGSAKSLGLNLTVHQALIVDPFGQEHKCFVKAAPQDGMMPFSEAIAWMIAQALDLPRPGFAALLKLPVQRLASHMKLDQHWRDYTHTLAFCCSTVQGKHIHSRWQWLDAWRRKRAFQHPDIARIAAFDEWVDNQDRHTGNFLRTHDGDYVPIDNEFVLYALVWAASLVVRRQSLHLEAKTTLKLARFKQFEVEMILASARHASAFHAVAPDLQKFITTMLTDPAHGAAMASAILQFLHQRADPDWLANELGHIA